MLLSGLERQLIDVLFPVDFAPVNSCIAPRTVEFATRSSSESRVAGSGKVEKEQGTRSA